MDAMDGPPGGSSSGTRGGLGLSGSAQSGGDHGNMGRSNSFSGGGRAGPAGGPAPLLLLPTLLPPPTSVAHALRRVVDTLGSSQRRTQRRAQRLMPYLGPLRGSSQSQPQ